MSINTMEKFKNAWPEALVGLFAIVVGVVLLWSATALASPAAPHAAAGGELRVVGAALQPNPFDALLGGFRATAAGRGVSASTSYAPASRQVAALSGGRAADVIGLDLSTDVDRLAHAGVVARDWSANRYHGIVADSVIAFAVRKGNPQEIHTWRTIAQPNIEVVLPNPFRANGGLWAVAAAYGAQRVLGRSQPDAISYLRSLLRNVAVQDSTDRQALKRFLGGEGDVLVGPESEIQAAIRRGAKIELVVPNQTLRVELPLALARKAPHAATARAFLHYAWSPAAQALLVKSGYRPVVASAEPKGAFAHPAGLFSIKKVGGWRSFESRFLATDTGYLTRIESELGVPTS